MKKSFNFYGHKVAYDKNLNQFLVKIGRNEYSSHNSSADAKRYIRLNLGRK